jgi:hypothetical protein
MQGPFRTAMILFRQRARCPGGTMKRHIASWYSVIIASLAVVGLGLITAPRSSAAAVDGDVRVGTYPNSNAVSVGGGVLAPVGDSQRWYFNPNVELAKGDGPDFVAMSGDFHYDFAREGNASFWMGGGPAVLVVDRPTGSNDTQLGVNVLTGVGKRTGDVRPFAQLRGTVAEDSRIALAGGIRF